MKIMTFFLAFCLQAILMNSSCKHISGYYDYRLKVINNSNRSIYAAYSQEYPDTTIVFSAAPFYSNPWKAYPSETITLGRGGSWEDAFKERIQQKLIIFIFDASIADKTPWDTIKMNYLILKRYDLTMKELDSLDFKVIYQ